jgi:methylated-DNA-[protein]-cysteine S-methyltransferase
MAAPLRVTTVPTPIGTFRLVYQDGTLHVVDLLERGHEEKGVPEAAILERGPPTRGSPPAQLKEYFAGKRQSFDVEFPPEMGTDFDRAVWKELCKVPSGSTITYAELARRSGHPGAARAVGGAMHRNPVPIVIPCHRVVGDDRSLTGFGLGLWRKRWLLEHEGAWPLRDGTPDGPKDPAQRTLDHPRRSSRAGRPRPRPYPA